MSPNLRHIGVLMQIKLSLFIKPFHNVCFLLLALPLLGYPTAAQSEFPQPLSFLECQFLCWLQTVGLSIFLRKFSVNWRFCPKINIRQSENGNNELNFHLLIDTRLIRLFFLSLILYFCSCLQTSESSQLKRLFQPLHFFVYLFLLLKRKVFTSSFF